MEFDSDEETIEYEIEVVSSSVSSVSLATSNNHQPVPVDTSNPPATKNVDHQDHGEEVAPEEGEKQAPEALGSNLLEVERGTTAKEEQIGADLGQLEDTTINSDNDNTNNGIEEELEYNTSPDSIELISSQQENEQPLASGLIEDDLNAVTSIEQPTEGQQEVGSQGEEFEEVANCQVVEVVCAPPKGQLEIVIEPIEDPHPGRLECCGEPESKTSKAEDLAVGSVENEEEVVQLEQEVEARSERELEVVEKVEQIPLATANQVDSGRSADYDLTSSKQEEASLEIVEDERCQQCLQSELPSSPSLKSTSATDTDSAEPTIESVPMPTSVEPCAKEIQQEAEQETAPHSEELKLEKPREIEFRLISEQGPTVEVAQQVESLARLESSESSEVVEINEYSDLTYDLDVGGQSASLNDLNLPTNKRLDQQSFERQINELPPEPIDEEADHERAEVVGATTLIGELKLPTVAMPEINIAESAPTLTTPTTGGEDEDLEWEFDNEPSFERRQVEVKRGCNPRLEYELGDELGRGKFGTVYRCLELASNRKLAAKFVMMRRREDREDVEREVRIMSQLQHKRLLQLYDAFDDGQDEMCLITELVEGGELFERIVDDDFELTEKKAAIFMRQICEGVDYMHEKQIVHLDMKPENILCVSKTGNRIKLIDFGLARKLNPKEPLRVMFGTPDFAAPEVLAYDTVSLATDMWSVGVICYVLLSGLSPFMGDNDMETMANVTRATYDFESQAFDPISDLAKDFISKLLIRDQSKRLKPSECLKHAWLQRGGAQLEASVRGRRESMAQLMGLEPEELFGSLGANSPPILMSLDKRNLKKYVVRRKWHKSVHAIMALGRMGANLKF